MVIKCGIWAPSNNGNKTLGIKSVLLGSYIENMAGRDLNLRASGDLTGIPNFSFCWRALRLKKYLNKSREEKVKITR